MNGVGRTDLVWAVGPGGYISQGGYLVYGGKSIFSFKSKNPPQKQRRRRLALTLTLTLALTLTLTLILTQTLTPTLILTLTPTLTLTNDNAQELYSKENGSMRQRSGCSARGEAGLREGVGRGGGNNLTAPRLTKPR